MVIDLQKIQKENKRLKHKKNSKLFKKLDKLIEGKKSSSKIFNRNQATIILPNKPTKPILRRSELFEKEYEKEKNLLGWK